MGILRFWAPLLIGFGFGSTLLAQSVRTPLPNSSSEFQVLVFLSSQCPSTKSHLPELIALQKEFKEFAFVGLLSEGNESFKEAEKFFQERNLLIPLLRDQDALWADHFRALKTPQAFVINIKGDILYQGALSDSLDLSRAQHLWLREALSDLRQNSLVRTPKTRPLGCLINRRSKP